MNKIVDLIAKIEGIEYDEISAKKNQTLFFEGDLCEKVGIVKSGKISIISYFSDGQEVIYNTLTKGDIFGGNLIFSSNPYYRGDVVASEESEIIYIKKDELTKALSNNSDFLELYLRQQSDFSKQLNFKIKLLTISNAKDRLVYYLTFNKKEIKYRSVTKLAKELYLTRETLSRTLYKMARDNEIVLKDKTITLK